MKLLKSGLYRNSSRLQRAASKAFNALKPGFRGIEVQLILMTLRDLERNSSSLPPSRLPRSFGPFGPPGAGWGPFSLDDFDTVDYSSSTVNDIKKFQRQAGNLEADGLAGRETIHRLDDLQFFLEGSGLLPTFS